MDTDALVELTVDRIVLTTLAAIMVERYPELGKALRSGLDTALGKSAIGEDTPDPLKIKMRKAFMDVMDQIEEFASFTVRNQKPLSLRRRFLRWLERG